MRRKLLAVVLALAALAALSAQPGGARRAAAAEPEPYTLAFDEQGIAEGLTPYYIPTSNDGVREEFSGHWRFDAADQSIVRVGDVGGRDVTAQYAVLYLNDSCYRFFELEFEAKLGAQAGLVGAVFGSTNLTARHNGSGNGVYLLPDPCAELAGSTLTVKATSGKFARKDGYYLLNLTVCGDFVRLSVDGETVIEKSYPAELIASGRVGLFTANTDGAFRGGVKLWNLDSHGSRIPLERQRPVSGVSLSAESVSLTLGGEPVRLTAAVAPADAANRGISWIFDAPDVAAIDADGNVWPLSRGRTVLYAVTDDGSFRAACNVTVEKAEVLVEGVTLDIDSYTGKVGDKFYLTPTVFPEDAEENGVVWRSSDTRVAMVMNGTVTLIGEGSCEITVRDENNLFTAVCRVTVEGEQAPPGGCGRSALAPILLALGALPFALRRKLCA